MQQVRKYGRFTVFGMAMSAVLFICVYWFVLHHQRNEIRHEVRTIIKNQVDRSDLTLLTFSPSELTYAVQWKHGKEFKFKGKMYDIIEREYKDGLVYYYCWKDEKENELNKKMDQLLAFMLGDNPQQKNQERHFERLAISLFCYKGEITISAVDVENPKAVSHLYGHYLNRTSSPPTPPPELS